MIMSWKTFLEKTKLKAPTPLVEAAIKLSGDTKGRALDLGAGAGVNAIALAKAGFTVDAVDNAADSIELITSSAKDLPLAAHLADITMFPIPPETYQIIVARYILPYLKKDEAEEVLGKIKIGLVSRGLLAVAVFGPEDDWAKSERKMSFWSADEMKALLSGMEIIELTEEKEPGTSTLGVSKFWHRITILARKK